MNYRHGYHAGNFADVFKHLVLISLLKNLSQKENAYCYLDTHAGAGMYDLSSEASQKSKEYEDGIRKIVIAKNLPQPIEEYIAFIKKIPVGNNSSVRYYPGSPLIAAHYMRAQDRVVFTELHKEEYHALQKNISSIKHSKKISVHLMDSYQGLNAFLPPKERRGLILIDPPYEKPTEMRDLIAGLLIAVKKFQTGVYAIWYPIKDNKKIEKFKSDLKKEFSQPILFAEFSIYPKDSPLHLNGCGMAIINPPWQLDTQLLEYLPWLWETLRIQKQGGYSVKILN